MTSKWTAKICLLTVSLVLICFEVMCAAAAEKGLVAHYLFDKGEGTAVVDVSGHGNDGKIIGGVKWVRGPFGSALDFNGEDGYVDCGTSESLNIASAGSVMVWVRPKTVHGGVVCWNTGPGWPDERLILSIDTYRGGANTIGCMADGECARDFTGFGVLPKDEWTHLAYTFDGTIISVYRDGFLMGSMFQPVEPLIEGVSLWIGKCLGLGKAYFHGMLDEVRIYNHPLSSGEIMAYYKKEASARAKDMSVFHRVGLEAHTYADAGKILVTLDARPMQPLPVGAVLRANLCRPGVDTPLKQIETRDIPALAPSEVVFEVQNVPAGSYVVSASAAGPDGARIGDESSVTVEWPGRPAAFRKVTILNNLCWELLNVRTNGINDKQRFTLPYDDWVFIRTTAEVSGNGEIWIGIDSDGRDAAIILHSEEGESILEAMRYLKAGKHAVHIGQKGNAKLKHLVVRRVPALQHAFYGANPHIHPYGPYDWEFLSKDILPNVNVMISGGRGAPAHLKEWKKTGRSWISITGVPRSLTANKAGVEKAYEHWSQALGFQHPLMDGVIVDEFYGGDTPIYDVYRQAVERIYASPKFKGKGFQPYGGAYYGQDRSTEFARVCIQGGGYIPWERYLTEQPTPTAARHFIRRKMLAPMSKWEEAFPGCTRSMIMVLGYMSQPPESLNINPSADFRAYMDMQMNLLATHPAFFGLGGIQEYHSAYSDEENVRLAGRLYRHYCIEGNTEPLIKDPFELTHIQNPDFADGSTGWKISPAQAKSVRTRKHPGYSWLEGRYPRTAMGDTFLWMKRSAKRPNVFSQEIKNLTPGHLYSMKMITADYQDLVQENSVKKLNAASIKLDHVEIVPGPKKCFQFTFPNCYAHRLGKFNAKFQYSMNYHWCVFRAKGPTAKLTITDWKSDTEPGGPIGQELIFNFIEVQPYLGD